MTYITEAELAERLKLDVEEVVTLRRKNRWPCLRFGRFNVRYTETQVAQIEALHTVKAKPATKATDQTDLSAKRAS